MSDFGGSNTPEAIRDIWQTPRALYDVLDAEFNFVGDVAASASNHLHKNYITKEQDSLSIDWNEYFGKGYKWCNPPYSDITPWVEKAGSERSLVMLIPSDTSVRWFKQIYDTADEVRLINGRLSFVRADTGEAQGGNNKGSMLCIWNPVASGTCKITLVDRDVLMNGEQGS